jgi:DNA-binding beta-propeller fold protein YncE
MNADSVLGQTDLSSAVVATTQTGMNSPYGAAYDSVHNRLFVVDNMNSRVLVYDAASIISGEAAVNVLGQPDFITNTHTTTQSGMYQPFGVAYDPDNDRLYVADTYNNRILVYDVASISNGEPAVKVLGQPDFLSRTTATTQTGMYYPTGVAIDAANQRLFVTDSYNNRVLVFDVAAISNGEMAVSVLGQTNFTSNTIIASQSGMYYPSGIAYDSAGQRLFVADETNNRILLFAVAVVTTGEDAINVLGQPDFAESMADVSQFEMSHPDGLAYSPADKRLFLTDEGNNRVIAFDVAAITNEERAINVLGQTNFTAMGASLSPSGMAIPTGVAYDPSHLRLFVVDRGHSRVMVYGP